jgi:Uma2 family endonuclease
MAAPTIRQMALTVGDREVRPLTADEVLRMVEAGVLERPERLELLHGALTEKPVKSPAHEAVKSRLLDWLTPGWARREYLVRVEAPLVVRDRLSLPEPDIAVVAPREYLARHPDSALLVVEVAESSRRIDTALKPPLYAAAGVPEYWVVDVPARRVERYTEPGLDGYRRHEAVEPPGELLTAAPTASRRWSSPSCSRASSSGDT